VQAPKKKMNKIDTIRDLDDEVFEIFQEYFPKTQNSKFIKTYPKTNLLISMLDTSGNFIKNSIFDCCETDDYYGMKILYRSLIEHYIRYKYIFIKWTITKSDEFSNDYFEFNNAREVLDLIKAKVSEKQLYDTSYKIEDWNRLLKDHPQFKNKTRKQVEKETSKYSFKNIIRFLNIELKKGEQEMSEFLGKLIVEYSELSSFVHGGMKSYQEMMVLDEEKREQEYNRISGLSFQLSGSIKMFNLILYLQTDKDNFEKNYLKMDKVLKRINEV